MREKTGKNIKCSKCGKKKYFPGWYLKQKKKKGHKNFYCSKECYQKAQKNMVNNGIPAVIKKCPVCKKMFKAFVSNIAVGKGKVCSKDCAKISISKALMKGKKRCYGAQHIHIRKFKDEKHVRYCVDCGVSSEQKKIELSNIDHKYSDNPDDYETRCRACHRKFDIENNNYRAFNK